MQNRLTRHACKPDRLNDGLEAGFLVYLTMIYQLNMLGYKQEVEGTWCMTRPTVTKRDAVMAYRGVAMKIHAFYMEVSVLVATVELSCT